MHFFSIYLYYERFYLICKINFYTLSKCYPLKGNTGWFHHMPRVPTERKRCVSVRKLLPRFHTFLVGTRAKTPFSQINITQACIRRIGKQACLKFAVLFVTVGKCWPRLDGKINKYKINKMENL